MFRDIKLELKLTKMMRKQARHAQGRGGVLSNLIL